MLLKFVQNIKLMRSIKESQIKNGFLLDALVFVRHTRISRSRFIIMHNYLFDNILIIRINYIIITIIQIIINQSQIQQMRKSFSSSKAGLQSYQKMSKQEQQQQLLRVVQKYYPYKIYKDTSQQQQFGLDVPTYQVQNSQLLKSEVPNSQSSTFKVGQTQVPSPIIVNANSQVPTYQQQRQERIQIVQSNGTSIQKWQEFSVNYVEQELRSQFLGQIYTFQDLHPIVAQYLKIIPQPLLLKNIQAVQVESFYQQGIILQTFNVKTKNRIIANLNTSANIQQFLAKEISHIIDILQRRCKLNDYFHFLVESSRNNVNFVKQFGTMKFVDFIIILQKFTEPNDIISFLLGQQNAPVPINLIASQSQINNVQLLINLLKFKKHHLVLNIWSQNSIRYIVNKIQNKKEVLFSETMLIDQIYLAGSHFGEVINLFQLNIKDKKMIFIDYVENTLSLGNKLILQLFHEAQLIIFHIDQKDCDNPTKQLAFLQKYQDEEAKKGNYSNKIKYFCQEMTLLPNVRDALKIYDKDIAASSIFRYEQTFNQKLQNFYNIFPTTLISGNQAFMVNNLSSSQLKRYTNYQQITSFLNAQLSLQKSVLLPKVSKQRELNKIRTQINNLSIEQIRNTKISAINQQNTQTMLQIVQESIKQYNDKLAELTKQEQKLEKELLVISLSPFVSSCKKYIKQENNVQIQEFIDGLIEKTNSIINTQIDKLNKKFPAQENKREKLYKDAKTQIIQNHISIDDIYYEYNVYNELTIDKTKTIPTSQQQFYINKYYQKCLNTQNSFNTVDGESSDFGNSSLQRFFQSLKGRQNKEIFVISIIGSKSSGKSTLFNYLFHYNIHMREDEYAKGIYLGQCQISNKTIVVLDTANIMSIDLSKPNYEYTAQQLGKIFATFDHQIASFVMKMSDLVIFAGFTDQRKDYIISQHLQLVVAVCYKVLNAIQVNNYSDQKKITPKRIMFALNQKSVTSQKIDKELAIQLMIKHLQPILLLQVQDPYGEKDPRKLFQKYMRLQAQDIFQLPSIYQNSQNVDVLKVNETYGLHILGLRSKILQHLEIIKNHRLDPQEIIGFYNKSQVNWDIIMLTGSNILKAQSLAESYQRQKVFQLYHSQYQNIYQQMIKDINQILPQTSFPPLTFTSLQVKGLIQKQKQGTFDSWTLFSVPLNTYLTTIYVRKDKNPSKYQQIIDKCTNIFLIQAQKVIPNVSKYADLYLTSIKKLFDVIFYRRIKKYYRDFQKVFAEGIQQFTFQKIMNIIIRLNWSQKSDKNERQKIYVEQTNKILNSEYFEPIKKETVTSNLNSLFGTILSSQDVFTKELQIRSINDCLNFDQKIHQDYLNNLNQFIYFENYQEVNQHFRVELAKLIENNVKLFEKQLTSTYKDRIISYDIRDNFQYVKNYIIDAVTNTLSLQVLAVSSRVYQDNNNNKENAQLIAESQQLQKKLAIQNGALQQEKDAKNNQLKEVQASLSAVAGKQQQKQKLLLQKKQLTQDLEQIERQITYLTNLRESIYNLAKQRITLGKINFVILLLAKMFKILQQLIYNQQLAQLNKLKAAFKESVLRQKQNAIQYLDKKHLQFNKSIEQDYNASVARWNKQFQISYVTECQRLVNQDIKTYNKMNLKRKIQKDIFFQNPSINYLTKQSMIEGYKYIANPSRYLIQVLYRQLTTFSKLQNIINAGYKIVHQQIESICSFKPKQVTEAERLAFLRTFSLQNMYTYAVSFEKDEAVVFTTEELITQFIKKLQSTKHIIQKDIKATASKQYFISYVQLQLYYISYSFIGCTQCCPICGSMCNFLPYHGGQHSTYHYCTAFGGCRDSNNQILLRNCSQNLKRQYWSYRYKTFNNHFQMIKYGFPNWIGEFSNQSWQQNFVSDKYSVMWANIQDVMIQVFKKRHDYRFGLKRSSHYRVNQVRSFGQYLTSQDIKNSGLQDYWVQL